jgi:hypothetical protein
MSTLQINGTSVCRTVAHKCTSDIIYQTADGRVYVDADVGYLTNGGVFPAGRLEADASSHELIRLCGRCECKDRGDGYCLPAKGGV